MKKAPRSATAAKPPIHFKSRIPFFGRSTERKALSALDFINSINCEPIRDLFSLAFGSVMVSLSNYSYEPSLSSRPAVGKPTQEDAPVAEALTAKLLAMKADIALLCEELGPLSKRPSGKVIDDNFLNAVRHLDASSIDLLVTSPPYLNNYHYVRNTRPQLFWLGFIDTPGQLRRL